MRAGRRTRCGSTLHAVEKHDRFDARAMGQQFARHIGEANAHGQHAVFRFVHHGREMGDRQARV